MVPNKMTSLIYTATAGWFKKMSKEYATMLNNADEEEVTETILKLDEHILNDQKTINPVTLEKPNDESTNEKDNKPKE